MNKFYTLILSVLTFSLGINAQITELFFSEYAEGSSNNKYLEIYNGTSSKISLDNYAFPSVANDPANPGQYEYWNTFPTGDSIAPGDVYIITHPSADSSSILAFADHTYTYLSNGDDGFALVSGGTHNDANSNGVIDEGEMTGYTLLDHIGNWAGDPGAGWDVAGVTNATKDHTLVRKASVTGPNPCWDQTCGNSSAGTNASDSEWIVYPNETWTNLGSHSIILQDFSSLQNVNLADNFLGFGGGLVANNTLEDDPVVGASNKVRKATQSAGGDNWKGLVFRSQTHYIDLTNSQIVSIDIYQTTASNYKGKIQAGTSSQADNELTTSQPHTGSGWETLSFDFTGSTGDFGEFVLFVNVDANGAFIDPAVQAFDMYFDNITAEQGSAIPIPPAGPTDNAADPTSLVGDVISIFSDSYLDVPGTNFNPNWNQSTSVNATLDPAQNGNKVLAYTNFNYQGTEFSVQDISLMEYLHVDIWIEGTFNPNVYVISSGTEIPHAITNTGANSWISVDIPVLGITGDLTNCFQFKFDGGNGSTDAIYLDNLYFWKSPTNTCGATGTFTYLSGMDISNSLNSFTNPGGNISLDFSAGSTEVGWDYWYINNAANGLGDTIATGTGSIVGSYLSTTGEISFYVVSDASVTGIPFSYTVNCPTCLPPTGIAASNITTTTLDLAWTPGISETAWNVEYGPAGFALGTGTLVNVTANPYTITGLTQGTSYDVYIQADCGSDSSSYAGPFTFTTSCGVNTAPWNESFSSAIPNCWSESGNMTALYGTAQTGDNWNFTNYNAYAGYYMHIGGNYQDLTSFPFGYCAFVNGNEGDGTYGPTTLTSPEVSVVPLTNPELSFLLNSNRESDTVNALLTVEASNDNGTTWSSVASLQGNTNGWIRQHVSLSAYTGDTVQVRFVYSEPDTAQLDHIAIDEVSIGEAVTCFEISNLSLSNVTGNSVDLNWVAGGSEASWDILASSSSGNVSVQSTDTSYTLTGLSGATSYNLYVRAICGVGDTSVWFGPVSLFTYPDGPNGVTCGLGDTNATLFSDGLESQGGWTGDFGAGNGIWKLGTGGTPSGGTGPIGAHEGSSYFFFESSTASSQHDVATIYSPLIDLSDAVGGSAELSFWLHAYGANMGDLRVGASSTLTGQYTNLAIFSGQIQGSSALAYANVGVDLSAYAGDTVFLSFTYTRNPIGTFTEDLAIDLIEVNSCIVPPPHDMAVVAAAVASGCDLTATEPIEVWVVNNGLVAESSFDLSYAVNGGTPVVESITSTLNVGDTLMHVFAATADMSADGVYNLDFGLVLALDNDTTDNSMMFSAENYLTPAALTAMGDSICNGETAMVSTTADGYAFWYDAATGGNLIGDGDVLDVTPSVTTSYYVEDAVVIGHSEDFDSFTVGNYIAQTDPNNWATWSGGTADDMPITDVQGNGGNSLRVFNADGTDVVMEFGEAISTGRFYYSMDMYLVAEGYINFQEDVVIGTEWNMSVTFISGVIDIAIDGASVLTGSYTSTDPAGNTLWNTFEFECNYSTGLWEVFADGVSQGTFVNPDPVASVNIYPGTNVEYYLDNVEWSAVTDDACRSERTEAVVTVNDCSNINELSFKDLNIYPNPNNGQFTITNSQEMTDIIITDLQGKIVYNSRNINLNKVNVELNNLERGMYMINIQTNNGMITKTVTYQ